jgi:hypothetical protein
MLREKRHRATSPDASSSGRLVIVPAGAAAVSAAPALDALEEEFLRLEHEEVARHTSRRKKGAT